MNQIEEVGEAHLIEAVEFFGQEMPRLGILNFLLAHEIHHRGQLSVYVRGAVWCLRSMEAVRMSL